ncbi:MAG: hypothetical protein ABSF40_17620 [Candidatus Acidiferrales bacterium]|jgi:hypothetical protein
MVNGRLSFRSEGNGTYRSNFAERGGSEHGAQLSLTHSTEEALGLYLIELQDPNMKTERPEERARQRLLEMRNEGSLVLDPVDLTEQQASAYRRVS